MASSIPVRSFWPAALILLFVPLGCGDGGTEVTDPDDDPTDENPPALEDTGTFTGTTADLGDGVVYPWVELEDGTPVRLGVTFTDAAAASLPATTRQFSLALPEEAQATTIYDHVRFDWNPQGHEPLGVYDVSHFDVHVYTISSPTRRRSSPSSP